jgi:hypothetical protein
MDVDVAGTVAHATRNQAIDDARSDLDRLRRRAVEAGREESRRLTKVSRIDPRSGEIRYRPAGRLMRDWYLHCYLNELRQRLGYPSVAVDAQQVEDMAAQLRRLAPNAKPLAALRSVALLRDVAVSDAAQAAVTITETLADVGARRALQHAPDGRFDDDLVRVHVTRHWYQRCYRDHIASALNARPPLTAVTAAEEHQVALALATTVVRRLVGDDGTVLVTAHGTRTNALDRAVASGEIGVVPATLVSAFDRDAPEELQLAVPYRWNHASNEDRTRWATEAGIMTSRQLPEWKRLPDEYHTAIVRHYLRVDGGVRDFAFRGDIISATPAEAARLMFNHASTLEATGQQTLAVGARAIAASHRPLSIDDQPQSRTHPGPTRGL